MKGRTTIVPATGQRCGLNLISAVGLRGALRFTTVVGRTSADRSTASLERLLHDAKRPIFLIVERHPSHRARKVLEFVRSTRSRLRLSFLPPDSPQLSPDELRRFSPG